MASLSLAVFLRLSKRWVPLPAPQARSVFLLGMCTYTFMGIGWLTALRLSPAWLVSLMIAQFPIPVVLGSWLFLRQRTDRQQVAALLLVIVGSIILFWRPLEGTGLAGALIMVPVELLNAAYVLRGQRLTQSTSPLVITLWTTLGAALGTGVYSLLSRQFSLDFAPVGWLWITLFALISTVAAIVLLWQSIAWIGPSRAAIAGSAEPVFSILIAIALLGEKMATLQMLGGCLVLAGVLFVQRVSHE
jgi:drug/metabolite transporter (DMT)-like permease